MITKLFSSIWDMTRWNRLDVKISTGKKQNKSTGIYFALWTQFGTLGVHNTMHVTIDLSSQIISPLIMGCGLHGFNRSLCMVLCTTKCRICSQCNKKSCTFVWFSPRSDLNIFSISACYVSNERKLIFDQIYYWLCLSRGYTLRVMIELIY